MEKNILRWQLYESGESQSVERYCHNCGKKVLFQDSLKRRHNANGKDIFEYAIYKCENGHSWNKMLDTYKASEDKITPDKVKEKETLKLDFISVSAYREAGIGEVVIILEEVRGKYRIDKLLSQQIVDLSRSQIEKLIDDGLILINDEKTKASSQIRTAQKITIKL
ncbi:MAG: cytoplasmic protein [Clostridiaceae bacterium]|nr:cytoplasmic protein [Clostridiaceae bacterium]